MNELKSFPSIQLEFVSFCRFAMTQIKMMSIIDHENIHSCLQKLSPSLTLSLTHTNCSHIEMPTLMCNSITMNFIIIMINLMKCARIVRILVILTQSSQRRRFFGSDTDRTLTSDFKGGSEEFSQIELIQTPQPTLAIFRFKSGLEIGRNC